MKRLQRTRLWRRRLDPLEHNPATQTMIRRSVTWLHWIVAGEQTAVVNRLTVERHVYIHGRRREELAVPIIDGTPLHEMVSDRLAGLAVALVAPPSGQWLGAPTYEENGRAVILDGTCGVAGCCGVVARITVTDETVRWWDFFARGEPPLPPGLEFEFERIAYEATINAVTESPEHVWTVTDDEP